MFLGIDFGTCFSSVATIDGDRILTEGVLGDDNSNGSGMPTVMAIVNDEVVCGFDCEGDPNITEKDKIRYIKRDIRRMRNIGRILDDRVANGYDYHALLTQFFRNIITLAVQNIRDNNMLSSDKPEILEGITVTVPCGFGTNVSMRSMYAQYLCDVLDKIVKDKSIQGLFDVSGTPNVSTVAEPVAAALAYITQNRNRLGASGRLLIVDIGGGTSDVTSVSYSIADDGKITFTVEDEDGDLSLGGNDWDEALYKKIYPDDEEFDPVRMRAVREFKLLLCKKGDKESTRDVKRIFTGVNRDVEIQMSRAEFDEATKALLQKELDLIRQFVSANGGINKFDRIVLVGGGCHMPQIREGLQALYPKAEVAKFMPSQAIAAGAAYYAKNRMKNMVDTKFKVWATYGIMIQNEKRQQQIMNLIFKGMDFTDGVATCESKKWLRAQCATASEITCKVFESKVRYTQQEIAAAIANNDAKCVIFNERNKEKFKPNGMKFAMNVPQSYRDRADEYKLFVKMELSLSEGTLTMWCREENDKNWIPMSEGDEENEE